MKRSDRRSWLRSVHLNRPDTQFCARPEPSPSLAEKGTTPDAFRQPGGYCCLQSPVQESNPPEEGTAARPRSRQRSPSSSRSSRSMIADSIAVASPGSASRHLRSRIISRISNPASSRSLTVSVPSSLTNIQLPFGPPHTLRRPSVLRLHCGRRPLWRGAWPPHQRHFFSAPAPSGMSPTVWRGASRRGFHLTRTVVVATAVSLSISSSAIVTRHEMFPGPSTV